MFALAVRSVRQRPGRLAATLLAAFFGAAVVILFNSLHDTAQQPGIDPGSAESLTLTAGVVGGYGTLLVLLGVASTLTLTVRQRSEEMDLLRRTGATPGQIIRMVIGEALLVATAGALLAVGPAVLGGRALVARLHETGQVAAGVDHVLGPIGLGAGFGVTLSAAAGAAWLAVRRVTRGRPGRHRLRTVAGALAVTAGAGGVGATFAMDPTEPALMAAPAFGSILISAGLAAFSPALVRALIPALGGPLRLLFGAGGHLAVLNLRRRATELAGVLMPLILFVGMATVTLCLQAVESDAIAGSGLTRSVEDRNLETLNLVVVGIVTVFCCLLLINSLASATAFRRREFGQQRLAGATRSQVLRMVGAEALVLVLTGVLAGTPAALAGVLSFTAVRTDRIWPGQALPTWLGIVAVAALAAGLAGLVTAVRTVRVPATVAVSA
ncbi:ABC transporter permease [Actinoplanes utahensis]|uniref:Transporter n=1 Tax=Actinoplanes utahensis TaxID=1869 RepID=A0A0A6UB66_ACTUT|nr:ABC transporter permease [Actinoplanes utahensis]KHD72278.1 transporter [Actinoplanes utahensis]GIF35565.1 transporter [Actinoplanes utahensis]